jgi:multiple sugar transport system permease protein
MSTATAPVTKVTAETHRQHKRSTGASLASAGRYIALAFTTVLFLLPFYLMLRNALSSDVDITSPNWTIFPTSLHWDNVKEVFNDPSVGFKQSLINSTFIALAQTAGTVLLASMCGYALARIPYRFSTPIFYGVLMTLMIPPAVTFVPSFIIVS